MKILFFLATLSNLTYFFWQYHEGGYAFLTAPSIAVSDNSPKQIQLLAEVKENQGLAAILPAPSTILAVNAPPTNLTPAPTIIANALNVEHPVFKEPDKKPTPLESIEKKMYCYLMSGFANKPSLANWLNRQPATTQLTRKIKKNKLVDFMYQVYYPASRNSAQSKHNLQIVKAMGIRDVFLIQEKPFVGDLSFGTFSEKARAMSVQQALIARGIYASIRKRPKMMAVIYVGIKSEKTKKELVDSLKSQANSFTIETVSRCK